MCTKFMVVSSISVLAFRVLPIDNELAPAAPLKWCLESTEWLKKTRRRHTLCTLSFPVFLQSKRSQNEINWNQLNCIERSGREVGKPQWNFCFSTILHSRKCSFHSLHLNCILKIHSNTKNVPIDWKLACKEEASSIEWCQFCCWKDAMRRTGTTTVEQTGKLSPGFPSQPFDQFKELFHAFFPIAIFALPRILSSYAISHSQQLVLKKFDD